ncbi:hypothetical protein Tco_0755220 [Tanacetum coccineum]
MYAKRQVVQITRESINRSIQLVGDSSESFRGGIHDLEDTIYNIVHYMLECTKMIPEEEDRVRNSMEDIPITSQGKVIAVEPTKLQDAVRIANNLMDQKLKGYAMKNAENK